MGETKPLKLSTILSITYSDFIADFREVRTSEGFLYIADLERRPAKPNKANFVKVCIINNMNEKSAKQTQFTYPAFYQLLAAILTAILRKFRWKGRGSLSRIRTQGIRCPVCLEEWRASNRSIYEPLLWSLRAAGVCPLHRLPLVSACPHCERPMTPIMSLSRPGYCGRCGGWLGAMPDGPVAEEVSPASSEHWVSNAAGDLLALAPRAKGKPGTLRQLFRENLEACVVHLFRGNGTEFAKFVGCTATSVYNWRKGAVTPHINQLLKLSDRLRISPTAFLTAPSSADAVDWRAVRPASKGYALPILLHRSSEEMRQALRLVLDERPAPSLSEVATRLGYRGTEGLRRVSRSLCMQITDNYKKSFGPEPYYNGPRLRICGRRKIEGALKAALAQDEPESVPHIARRLGYKGSGPFFRPFPALCRAIYIKIARRKAARIRAIRRAVEKALRRNPPPTLRALAVQLGFKDKAVIGRYCGELRARLLARRKALAERQAARLRKELQLAARARPAPSLAEICRGLGLKQVTASRRFPRECRLLVTRYQRRRRTLAGLREQKSGLHRSIS